MTTVNTLLRPSSGKEYLHCGSSKASAALSASPCRLGPRGIQLNQRHSELHQQVVQV